MWYRQFLSIVLLIAASSACIYQISVTSLILWLICVALCVKNFNQQMIWLLLCLFVPFLIYFSFDSYALNKQADIETQKGQVIQGIIFPDTISIDGYSLCAEALVGKKQTKTRLYYKLKTVDEKRQWQSIHQVVEFHVKADIIPIMAATNFNQFDAQKYFKAKHITHRLNVLDWQELNVEKSTHYLTNWRYAIHCFHADCLNLAQRLPMPLNEYAQSLILGVIPSEFYEDNPGVQTLGLIHLFSVSGFHVSYVLRLITGVLRRTFLPKEIIAGVGIVALCAYFIFAGESAILIRALVTGVIAMLRLASHLKVSSEIAWSLSLLVSLLYEPGILLTLGGQLSFSLTFCLMFTRGLSFWQTNLWLSVVSFPLIVYHQYVWHVLQTPVNFLAIPVFSTVIVPCVLLGFFGRNLPLVSDWMNGLIQLFTCTLNGLADFPGLIIVGKIPSIVVLILFICSLFFAVFSKIIKKVAITAWIIICCLTMIWIKYPLYGEWATFDIGQGDASLIREPFNKTVTLIDTGGQVEFGNKSHWQNKKKHTTKGELIIVNYLHSLGINHVNQLVLTHQDMDHIGDAKVILSKLKVDCLVIPKGMKHGKAFQRELAPYLRHCIVHEVTANNKLQTLPMQIVHPFQSGKAQNQDSIALFTKLGGMNVFTAGDLDRQGELEIARQYPNLKVDILKLGHHGSKTSSDPEVIAKWQPRYGIISAGRDNRYHHPHIETIKICKDNKMVCFNTQNHGMIRYIYRKNIGYFEVKLAHEFETTSSTN